MSTQRNIEVFIAGCPVCEETVQMVRVLKLGERFKLLEMVYSQDCRLLRRQRLFTPFVEAVYGVRFDRHALEHLRDVPGFEIVKTRFLKADTYLLIEGGK